MNPEKIECPRCGGWMKLTEEFFGRDDFYKCECGHFQYGVKVEVGDEKVD